MSLWLRYDLKREYFTLGVPVLLASLIVLSSLFTGPSPFGGGAKEDVISERQRAYEELLRQMEASELEGAYAEGTDRPSVPTGESLLGTHIVRFVVVDGALLDTELVPIIVSRRISDRAPELEPIPAAYGRVGETVSVHIKARDPDGNTVEYTIESGPHGLILENDTVRWVPDSSGIFSFTVIASDGYLEDREEVHLYIGESDPNDVAGEYLKPAPKIEHIPPKHIVLNETVSFTVRAWDAKGNPLSVRADLLPPGATFEKGVFTWKAGSGTPPGIFDQIRFGFDHILVLALLIAITPYGIDLAIQKRRIRRKEELYTEFLFKLSELMRGGLDPIKSVTELSKSDLGELTPHIRLAATSMMFGKTFEEAMDAMAESLGSELISRYTELLIVASYSGGSVADLILKASEDMREILEIEREKEGNLSQYTFIFYFAQGINAFIAYTLATSLLPFLQSLGAQTLFGVNALANLDFRHGFFHLLIINAFFGGLIIGKITEGEARYGLKHASVLIAACYILSVLFILPPPLVEEEANVRIQILSGEDQEGIAGLSLPQPLVFLVEDFRGEPVANREVIFSIQPEGQVSPATKKTDAEGRVSVKVVLGSREGVYVITAKVGGAVKNVQIRTAGSE